MSRDRGGSLSRRATLSLLAAGSLGLATRGATADATRAKPGNVLVCVFLRGAADGLNIVVPHADRDYYRLRPTIAVAPPGKPNGALELDGRFGLHPRLSPLVPAWDAGELAFVHAVGSPHPTRSHFEAQNYAETGTPGARSMNEGFLARYLSATRPAEPSALRAVAFSDRVPLALRGYEDALSVSRLDQLRPAGDAAFGSALGDGFAKLYAGGSSRATRSAERALEVARRLRAIADSDATPDGNASYESAARPFAELARLLKADIGLETAWLDFGGWDTHKYEGGAERGDLPRRLDFLGKALAAFRADLGARFERVVVVVLTEFGRTAAENGTGGTDHGHASAMLVLGGPVRGKHVYGDFRGLAPGELHERRDLAVTTDFRAVLGEVIETHLGFGDRVRLFPGYAAPKRLGIVGG
jgi:uncharacterized protein (DUF1501 family)